MFELESRDPIFKIFIRLFGLIYLVGATAFLMRVKPVMEVSAIFLCASLWVFAMLFYGASTKWGPHKPVDKSIMVDHWVSVDEASIKFLVGSFYALGSIVVFIAANTELFFLVVVAGYIMYMAIAYLAAYLLTRLLRYFYPKKVIDEL